ncbi:glutathione S- transferase, nitrogen catabolite repression regulator [Neocucurbitaria cava]|uniref:glutathione transferase n=1 Tax=Neocucurbitaria cava TaxID=798079 RepID=A0A9W8YIH4_9PLEO|nr:glutathione S- transferase, nitrogen catabolite repression regulator [Neocucurbitaria cava]
MPSGPNAYKVLLILEELSLPYTLHPFPFSEVKQPPFTDLNPNGRNPAIQDPNTDLTLWESGAIVQYLISQYDVTHKLTYEDVNRKHQLNQFMMFQMSGQGPYYGQAGWFTYYHPEKIPSAIERYRAEIRRVLGVLEVVLERSGTGWLVGDKCTYADLAFLPYNTHLEAFLQCGREERFEGCPRVKEWHERMEGKGSWKKCTEVRVRLMSEQGLGPDGRPKEVESKGEGE